MKAWDKTEQDMTSEAKSSGGRGRKRAVAGHDIRGKIIRETRTEEGSRRPARRNKTEADRSQRNRTEQQTTEKGRHGSKGSRLDTTQEKGRTERKKTEHNRRGQNRARHGRTDHGTAEPTKQE